MSFQLKRPRIGLVIGGVLLLSGFGYLMSGQIGGNLVYFLTPSEALAKGQSVHDRPIRLGGLVAPNSVQWDAEALDLRFVMVDEEGDGSSVHVHARKAPPTMFREGMGVVVEGRMTGAGVFESTNVMVKHSNEYRAPEEGHDPATLYRTLIRDN